MSVISQTDFEVWKADPVTKAFFLAAQERIEQAKEVLSVSAGLNPLDDSVLRGLILAYNEIQEFRIEDTVDD